MVKHKSFSGKKSQELEIINPNVAGIDIGSKIHWVCVPPDRYKENIRTFNVFTSDLKKMGDWLLKCGIEQVVMESTGTYWIPVFDVLEKLGLQMKLVNAKDVKNAPGRKKTDKLDCAWLQKLGTYGLLTASFIPPHKVRMLNCLITQRDNLVRNSSTFIQRMQKSLVEMNLFLHNVISDITGKTGIQIIRAIVNGETDAGKLARFRDGRIKSSKEAIRKSLEGNYNKESIFALSQNLELYDILQNKIFQCEKEILKLLDTMESKVADSDLSGKGKMKMLHRILGTDCTKIPGFSELALTKILSKTGFDLSVWPTSKHFTSWLGLSPNNRITGGKIISAKSKKVTNSASQAFRQSAVSLRNSKTYLGAFMNRMRIRFGPKKATAITARKIAVIFYNMVRNCTEYEDLGREFYNEQYQQRYLRSLKRKARKAGYILQPAKG